MTYQESKKIDFTVDLIWWGSPQLTTSFLTGIKNYFCMYYNWYLYQLSMQAVLITDIVKNGISATDIIANPIIGTSLHTSVMRTACHYIASYYDGYGDYI